MHEFHYNLHIVVNVTLLGKFIVSIKTFVLYCDRGPLASVFDNLRAASLVYVDLFAADDGSRVSFRTVFYIKCTQTMDNAKRNVIPWY